MRNTLILASALLVVGCDTPNAGQADQQAGDETAMDGSGSAADDMEDSTMTQPVSTGTYVTMAANSDMYEIEAGRLAVKNAQSEQVRKFGQMMIDDHTRSSSDLKAALAKGEAAGTVPTRLDAEHQAMIDRLKNASGEAFDQEYMSQQMTAHRKALALHQSYAASGDNADLKAFAQKVVPVVRKHHDRMGEMMGASGASGTGATMDGSTGTAAGTGTGTSGRTGTSENSTGQISTGGQTATGGQTSTGGGAR